MKHDRLWACVGGAFVLAFGTLLTFSLATVDQRPGQPEHRAPLERMGWEGHDAAAKARDALGPKPPLDRMGWIQAAQVGPLPKPAEKAPPKELMGWAGEEAAEQARVSLAAQGLLAKEISVDPQVIASAKGRVIRLWDFSNIVLGGKHIPTYRQAIGDCVSFGTANALMYSSTVAISLGRSDADFEEVFQPYLYGCGRVFVAGKRSPGDGSTGIWQKTAVEQYGALSYKAPGVPAYSRSVAYAWSGSPGPPQKFVDIGKRYKVEGRLVASWDALVQSISQGYAVAVCSGQGFRMEAVERNGRLEGIPSGGWAHCMCFIAVDDRPGREAVYCLNSWGPTAHGNPADYKRLDNAPPGGFWIHKDTADRMLRQRDSYAYSFDGFRGRPLFPVGAKGQDQ